ncbi:MAG TPA: exodeoxyribonuclease VII large subunit, partial [Acidimicrobiales bacterium]
DRQRHAMATGARLQIDRHADRLDHRARTVRGAVKGQLDSHAQHLATKGRAVARGARWSLAADEERLSGHTRRLAALPARRLQVEDLRVAQWRRLLGAYDYQRQLERGYSVTRDGSGAMLRSVSGLGPGSHLVTQLSDGEVSSVVTEDGTGNAGGTGGDIDKQHDEGKKQ